MNNPNEPSLNLETGFRIPSLDVLRGFAVLGILAMNIQVFSMPAAACLNGAAYAWPSDVST